jgi:methionyl-tRNA formyltransferase
MTRKRIAFIGSSEWGLRALRVLTELDDIEVVGAVTNPAIFRISYRPDGVKNVHHADVPSFCDGQNIPTYMMGTDESMKSEALLDTLREWRPDYFFALGWYHVIPAVIRDLAPVLGIHYSLLPDYSGGAPLVWALINHEQTVGATLFQLDGGIDTGPMIGQIQVEVEEREKIGSLYPRVGEASLILLRRDLPKYIRGEIVAEPQNHSVRRVFPQRSPEDGEIDWRTEAKDVDAFIRAQTRPYPGAFSILRGHLVKVWAATPTVSTHQGPAGHPFQEEGLVLIHCAEGVLRLDEVEIEGAVYHAEDIAPTLTRDASQLFACP